MTDAQTLAVYDARAGDYATHFAAERPDRFLAAFMAELPPGAFVLDMGCGPGTASAFLTAAGHRVDAVDASPGMVALARERGVAARLGSFVDVAADAVYDGVWANFSLLHAPRAEVPGHVARLARALRAGGVFHLGMKLGTGEGRDRLGRFYSYFTRAELEGYLAAAGLVCVAAHEGSEVGLAGVDEPFVLMRARCG